MTNVLFQMLLYVPNQSQWANHFFLLHLYDRLHSFCQKPNTVPLQLNEEQAKLLINSFELLFWLDGSKFDKKINLINKFINYFLNPSNITSSTVLITCAVVSRLPYMFAFEVVEVKERLNELKQLLNSTFSSLQLSIAKSFGFLVKAYFGRIHQFFQTNPKTPFIGDLMQVCHHSRIFGWVHQFTKWFEIGEWQK